MAYLYQEEEVTTVDPLNLALRAKSKVTRAWWWFVTIADVAALIYVMTLLILKYQSSQTNAVIHLKRNHAPFPAVTFCNKNPYKRSALAKIPKLAYLFDQFNNASKSRVKATSKTDANGNKEANSSGKRSKRNCLTCSSSGSPSVKISTKCLPASASTGSTETYLSPVFSTDPSSLAATTFTSITTDNQMSTDQATTTLAKTLTTLYTSSFAAEASTVSSSTSAATVYVAQSHANVSPAAAAFSISSSFTTSCLNSFESQQSQPVDSTDLSNNAISKLLISTTATTLTSLCPDKPNVSSSELSADPLSANKRQSVMSTIAPTAFSPAELASALKPTLGLTESIAKLPSTVALLSQTIGETSLLPFATTLVNSHETSTNIDLATSVIDALPTALTFGDAAWPLLALSSSWDASLLNSDEGTALIEEPFKSATSIATSQSLDKTSVLTLEDVKTSVLLGTIDPRKSSETTFATSFMSTFPKSISDARVTSSTIAYAPADAPKYENKTSATDKDSQLAAKSVAISAATDLAAEIANVPASTVAAATLNLATSTVSFVNFDMSTETYARTLLDSASESFSQLDSIGNFDEPTIIQVANADAKMEQSTKLALTAKEFFSTTLFPLLLPATNEEVILQAPSTPFLALQESSNNIFDSVKEDPSALSAAMEDALAYAMASLPEDEKEKAGYALSELIMHCVYNGVRCSFSDFQLKIDPNYGNCYTFNYDGKHAIALRAGELSGLSVTYNARNDEYLDHLQMTGVRVVVHEKDEPIFPNVMGFDVPSGYQSSNSLTKVQLISDPLVKACAKFASDVPVYYYRKRNFYSTEACIRSCYQNHVVKRCQCGDPRISLPDDGRFQYCTLANRGCVNENYNLSANEINNCNCPPACQFVNYEITQTNTRWAISYGKNLQWSGLDGPRRSDFKKNELAQIDVYYQTLDVTEYEETMLYIWSDLMWQLSSIIGLALGISVISLFEVIQLALWCRRKCRA